MATARSYAAMVLTAVAVVLDFVYARTYSTPREPGDDYAFPSAGAQVCPIHSTPPVVDGSGTCVLLTTPDPCPREHTGSGKPSGS
ncbi:hypothetical protein [Streptomyces sp. NBC_00443]|uniref:hypothetical protein n=1 Tax=Streptomyces sp. NBC_00443 TaxID=2975743 RepID=UPI002E1F45C7